MAHIDKVLQPVVKAPAQRVDSVIVTGPVIPDWLDDNDLVGAYSLYDLYGSGNSIMQLSGQGGTQRIDFTQAEYENINSDGKGLPSSLTVLDKLYNQVPGSSNSDLSETTGNLSNRPSVAFRPYNRFDHVLFGYNGQYSGHILSMSNLSNISLSFDSDVTFVVIAQNNSTGNDPYSTYPFLAGFQYAESMGLSSNDDFRGMTAVDTAQTQYLQVTSHDSNSSRSAVPSTSGTTNFSTSSFATVIGNFEQGPSNDTCSSRAIYYRSGSGDPSFVTATGTDIINLGNASGSSNFEFLSIGGRRGGYSTTTQDRVQMDFKALLVYKKRISNATELSTIATNLQSVVL